MHQLVRDDAGERVERAEDSLQPIAHLGHVGAFRLRVHVEPDEEAGVRDGAAGVHDADEDVHVGEDGAGVEVLQLAQALANCRLHCRDLRHGLLERCVVVRPLRRRGGEVLRRLDPLSDEVLETGRSLVEVLALEDLLLLRGRVVGRGERERAHEVGKVGGDDLRLVGVVAGLRARLGRRGDGEQRGAGDQGGRQGEAHSGPPRRRSTISYVSGWSSLGKWARGGLLSCTEGRERPTRALRPPATRASSSAGVQSSQPRSARLLTLRHPIRMGPRAGALGRQDGRGGIGEQLRHTLRNY